MCVLSYIQLNEFQWWGIYNELDNLNIAEGGNYDEEEFKEGDDLIEDHIDQWRI